MNRFTLASTVTLAPLAAVGLWNLVGARRLRAGVVTPTSGSVSLLIPARDEEENLRRTLPALLRLDHPDLEILVLDDGSSDDTAALIERAGQASRSRIRLIRGRPLPGGWLGKSWACHQLALEARGDTLIFCDADVEPMPDAVGLTLDVMHRAGASALTALPRQIFAGWAPAAVVPLVAQLPICAMLPLPMVSRSSIPSLSAGNGQWIAFTREIYTAIGGHASVRSLVLEDVALARAVKRSGGRLEVVIARDALRVRMYSNLRQAREGFAKNLYPLVGGTPLGVGIAATIFSLTAIFPWVAVLTGAAGASAPFGLLVLIRAAAARSLGHSLMDVRLHPIGSLLVPVIALESMLGARRGVRWKGRKVATDASS